MSASKLRIFRDSQFKSPRMIVGFSGWMNVGEVSTGTIQWLIENYSATEFAQIDPDDFYIYNLPAAAMDPDAIVRPYTRIKDGMIVDYDETTNKFFYDKRNDLILFEGKEPNLNWDGFSECMLSLCKDHGVQEIYFIGSVAGLVPHTRESRIICSLSDETRKQQFADCGFRFADYEGPASYATHLTVKCQQAGIFMVNLIIPVPAYVQGDNPGCIEFMLRNLKHILGCDMELDKLRKLSDEFERRLNVVIEEIPDLRETIKKLEIAYDEEVFDHEMGDMKDWLEERGVRLD